MGEDFCWLCWALTWLARGGPCLFDWRCQPVLVKWSGDGTGRAGSHALPFSLTPFLPKLCPEIFLGLAAVCLTHISLAPAPLWASFHSCELPPLFDPRPLACAFQTSAGFLVVMFAVGALWWRQRRLRQQQKLADEEANAFVRYGWVGCRGIWDQCMGEATAGGGVRQLHGEDRCISSGMRTGTAAALKHSRNAASSGGGVPG